MALPSAAAPASEAQQEDVTHNAEAKPAEAAISQEASHKQGTASEPQAAPMQAVQAVELQLAPQPASQQLANSSAAAAQSLPVPPTATAPHTDAAPSDGTQMTAQAESPKATGIHNTLDIVCADVQGVLTLDFKSMRCFILYKGQEMSGTEFEKAAGREKAKKWKTSVRVAPINGKQGEMVGDWLQRHGLDVRMSQLFKVGEARPAAIRAPAASRPSAPRPTAPRPSGPRPPPPNSTATLASVSDNAILEHLDKQYIGLQQGDPDVTFDKLPAGEPRAQLEPGTTLLDLRTVSYQQLMDLSAASAADPFGELLPFNPGVLPSRLGYMTGQQPKRQRVTSAPDPTKAHLLMGQYLTGAIAFAPWEAMGMSKAPVLGGRELDLRKFHDAVQECGGFEAAVNNKKFARIAVKLGIDLAIATNAAYLLKYHYQRLLAPYLQDREPQTDAQQSAAPGQGEAGLDDLQVDYARAEPNGSEPNDSEPTASARLDDDNDKAGLDDSTIQQHSVTLSVRLQSQPDQVELHDNSDSEDPVDQTLPLPVDFKATLVDASGPIPGLEDL